MNLVQQFLDEANRQISDPTADPTNGPLATEAFTFDADPGKTVYYGTFGDPVLQPTMTRQGWQDALTIPLKARAAQWAAAPTNDHKTITRTSNGRKYYVQQIDYTAVVVYTFVLTDRAL